MQQSISLILVSGGMGTRMEADVPKQFLLLNGQPILIYALKTFSNTFPDAPIVIVAHKDYINHTKDIVQEYLPNNNIRYETGGQTRFHSVKNGLQHINTEYVMIHDAVRPFINSRLLHNLLSACKGKSNAIPAVPVNESVRQTTNNNNKIIDRNSIRLIQTPQTFTTNNIQAAFLQQYDDSFTDDASVLEHHGHSIQLVEGLPFNIKITRPIDLQIADAILSKNII